MAISFKEYKRRLIKSGKRITVTKKAGGKVISKDVYSRGKKVSSSKSKSKPTTKAKQETIASNGSRASQKSYVDKVGVIRREGGTGFRLDDYKRAVSGGVVGRSGISRVRDTGTQKGQRLVRR